MLMIQVFTVLELNSINSLKKRAVQEYMVKLIVPIIYKRRAYVCTYRLRHVYYLHRKDRNLIINQQLSGKMNYLNIRVQPNKT